MPSGKCSLFFMLRQNDFHIKCIPTQIVHGDGGRFSPPSCVPFFSYTEKARSHSSTTICLIALHKSYKTPSPCCSLLLSTLWVLSNTMQLRKALFSQGWIQLGQDHYSPLQCRAHWKRSACFSAATNSKEARSTVEVLHIWTIKPAAKTFTSTLALIECFLLSADGPQNRSKLPELVHH